MMRAGDPATTTPGGTLPVTTLAAPTTDPAPITTPGSSTAPAPIQTSSSMRTGAENWLPSRRRSGCTGCPVVVIVTFGASITRLPMKTSTSSTSVRLKLTYTSSARCTRLP